MKNLRQYMRVANRFPSILGVPEKDELYVFVISLAETLEQFEENHENYPSSFFISDVFKARCPEDYTKDTFVLRRKAFSTDSMDFSGALRGHSVWVEPKDSPNAKENMKLGFNKRACLAYVEYHPYSKAYYGNYMFDERWACDMEIVHWPSPDLFYNNKNR